MEINRLRRLRKLKANLKLRRGTIAVGAIAIVLMFLIIISCIAAIVMEYSNYSKGVQVATLTAGQKAKENLLVQASDAAGSVTVTIINQGPTPTIVIALLTMSSTDNSIQYYNLPQPLTCTVLGQQTFTANPQDQQNSNIGVLTSLGNVFWQTQQAGPGPSPTPTPPPQQYWLAGWQYQKSHTINPSAGAGTDYQIKITVNYGSGTDNAGNVYLNSHSRTDFADVRFTDGDGVTLLSYWMETEVHQNYAVFWVKIPDDLSTNSAPIYIYYGNPTATTESNGPGTFLMFKDIVADLQNQFGTIPLTNYINTQDPGDGFAQSSPVDSAFASPCLWFRYYGGKQFQITSSYIYLGGSLGGGNYGTCGIDLRFRNNAAPTGWQRSNSITADTTINRKNIVAIDYSVSGSAILNFFSTWVGDSDDFPTGTSVASYGLTSTSRTTQEFTYQGTLAHTTLGYSTLGDSLTLYHQYYAIAKYVSIEPSQGTWGPETSQP
jgi:hypothetical protein